MFHACLGNIKTHKPQNGQDNNAMFSVSHAAGGSAFQVLANLVLEKADQSVTCTKRS